MNDFQTTELGAGLLKQNYMQGDQSPQLTALKKRQKKQADKIKSQLSEESSAQFDEKEEG